MRLRLPVALLALALSGRAAGQQIDVERAAFLPPRFYVGDRVELRITIVSSAPLELVAPAELPQRTGVTVHAVDLSRVNERSWTIRVFFTSYRPGTQALPDLVFGDTVVREVKISTSSVLDPEERQDLSSPRDQLHLRGTTGILVAVALAVACVPGLGVPLALRFARAAARAREARRRRLPALRFFRRMRRVRRALGSLGDREFFIAVTEVLKRYLQERLGVPALGLTTREISRSVGPVLSDSGVRAELEALLKLSDDVKFGGKRVAGEKLALVLGNFQAVVTGVEELGRADA